MLEQFLRCSRSTSPATAKILLVAATVLFMPMALSGQLVTGSIAVLQSAGDYLVIAADSKSLSHKGVSLHRCKIVALDDQLVYAGTGYTSYAGVRGAWDASDIVKQHYHLLTKTPRHDLIRKLAEAYGASLAARLDPDVKGHPEEGWPTLLAAALFAGFDENRWRVVIEVTIHQEPHNGVAQGVGYSTKLFPASDAVFADVIGETAVAQEFAAGRTLRSQSWRNGLALEVTGLGVKERLIAGAEKIVELTAKYQPSLVGGSIEAVLVSRNMGVKCIRRKPECAKGLGRASCSAAMCFKISKCCKSGDYANDPAPAFQSLVRTLRTR